jgi:hypothetical protein
VFQDVGDLRTGEHEVDRHHDGAQPGQRIRTGDVLPAIVRHDRDPIATPDAALGERPGGPVDRLVELGEGPPQLAVDQGKLARQPGGRAPEQVTEAVRPGLRDLVGCR